MSGCARGDVQGCVRGWWQELSDLVLPVDCAGCGLPRNRLCARCRGVLDRGGAVEVCPEPPPAGLPPVRAVVPYGGEVREMLLAHKERGALALARPLGAALAAAVRAHRPWAGGGGTLLLVPVPSARRAVARRGHDPTRRIGFAAAAVLRGEGRPVRVMPALRQRRVVADQAGLPARERAANLAGALEVRGAARGWVRSAPVVLVDDLVTTGASLAESARSVRAAGGKVIGAAVVAAPPGAFVARSARAAPTAGRRRRHR
ncbi:ComF family protein [Streptomyces zingiberis]|uniref:ComF family protein n=1 Tax=Streptomyces zingiberis TaxID=2053010 RepID=A0ABX1BZ33_9ACTN|nr:phosphoribosyltransferase family protein [Streptomyces zingiberis]NJQ01751.1 ComF family protein [Streptomyces zingiberis]